MSVVSEEMKKNVAANSAIRQMFEEGKKRAAIYGSENVFDFSIGNPSVAVPKRVKEAILEVLEEENELELHGYMSNAGYPDVRRKIAESINEKYGSDFGENNVVMTVGAGGALSVIFKAILNPGDEVIVIRPYFFEYNNYVKNNGGIIVQVEPDLKDFSINFEDLERKITAKTRAVIINSPNNPSGTIYSEDTLKKLGNLLEEKGKEFDTTILVVSDEPYRELAYDGIEVPFIPNVIDNSIIAYSWSKTLSIPGERIGYILVSDKIEDAEELFNACAIAVRTLGFVNAPSLIQKVVAKCLDVKVDINVYDKNRKALFEGLTQIGYECVKPQGAFYMFVKAPIEDENEFVEKCKEKNIMLVGGSAFACPGYVRISYCTSYESINNSLAKFEEVYKELLK
ncbi:MAG: pyridoxal phosphate-dependent aminotransferase [Parasporobacterium sp.]|nr:pyridoxal phosphate-dependent aminotransferase [Parasporobacterium sp.]